MKKTPDVFFAFRVLSRLTMGRTYRQSLAQPGAHAFLWTQFLGAFNDNIFKIVVSFMAMTALGPVDGVAFTGAVFILRRRMRGTGKVPPYRTPFYPVLPAVFIAVTALLLVNTVMSMPGLTATE